MWHLVSQVVGIIFLIGVAVGLIALVVTGIRVFIQIKDEVKNVKTISEEELRQRRKKVNSQFSESKCCGGKGDKNA